MYARSHHKNAWPDVARAALADLGDVLDDGEAIAGLGDGPEPCLTELDQRLPALGREVDRLEDLARSRAGARPRRR